jgi:hypothetical protein
VPGVEQYLAGHGVQRPDFDHLGASDMRCQPPADPPGQLNGGIAVEGDDADSVWLHAALQQDAQPGHEGRCLAAAGRRDDEGRPVRQRGRRALLRVECRQERVGLGMRHGERYGHSLRATAYRRLNARLLNAPTAACACHPGAICRLM